MMFQAAAKLPKASLITTRKPSPDPFFWRRRRHPGSADLLSRGGKGGEASGHVQHAE